MARFGSGRGSAAACFFRMDFGEVVRLEPQIWSPAELATLMGFEQGMSHIEHKTQGMTVPGLMSRCSTPSAARPKTQGAMCDSVANWTACQSRVLMVDGTTCRHNSFIATFGVV